MVGEAAEDPPPERRQLPVDAPPPAPEPTELELAQHWTKGCPYENLPPETMDTYPV